MSPCDIPEDIISFHKMMYKNTENQIYHYDKIDEKTNKRLYYAERKKAQVMVKILENLWILYPDLIVDNHPRY
jgi:site-specific DNA-adenine methylase